MWSRLFGEGLIVATLTFLLILLTATVGLPSRSAKELTLAAEETTSVGRGVSPGSIYRAVPAGIPPRIFIGMSGQMQDVR